MNYVKLILILVLSQCAASSQTKRNYLQDTSTLNLSLSIDPLSSVITTDDTSLIEEIIFTSNLFDNETIDSVYIYKDLEYTCYIEYYFKSKTITYFLSKGYIRKTNLIVYENKTRNPRRSSKLLQPRSQPKSSYR
jgi:hypothetical protein